MTTNNPKKFRLLPWLTLLIVLPLACSFEGPYYLNDDWHTSNPILAVVHSRGSLNGVLRFESETLPSYSRIQGAYLAVQETPTQGSVTPPDFKVTEADAQLTISWINVQSVAAPLDDGDTGVVVSSANLFDFPKESQASTLDVYADPDSITPDSSDMTYLFNHFYVDTQHDSDLNCSFDITFTGSIRGVYLNDVKLTYVGTKGVSNNELSRQKTFSYRYDAILKTGMINVVSLIGSAETSFSSFEFTTCDEAATLVYYVSDNLPIQSEDITGPSSATLTSPEFPVLRIQDTDEVIACDYDYYWEEYACVQTCYYRAHSDHICSYNQLSVFLISEVYTSTSYQVELYLDFEPQREEVIIFIPMTQSHTHQNAFLHMFQSTVVEDYAIVLYNLREGGPHFQHTFNVRNFDTTKISLYVIDEFRGSDRNYLFLYGSNWGTFEKYVQIGEQVKINIGVIYGYFFIKCIDPPCNIIYSGSGLLQFYVDGFLRFDANLGSGFVRVLELQDKWTAENPDGYHYAHFENNWPESIKIEITGTYEIITPGPIQGQLEITPAGFEKIDCSSFSDCRSCNATTCLSCSTASYYINDDGNCVASSVCPGGYGSAFERQCISNCEENFQVYDSRCIFSCDPGTYMDSSACKACQEGCTQCSSGSGCDSACALGTYESGENCLDCPQGCQICDQGACYRCEEGYSLNADGECEIEYRYVFDINEEYVINSCGEQVINFTVKRIHPTTLAKEDIFMSTGFVYQVTSVSNSNQAYRSNLNNLLSGFRGNQIILQGEQVIEQTSFSMQILHNSNELIHQQFRFEHITIQVTNPVRVSIFQGDSIQVSLNQPFTLDAVILNQCGRSLSYEWEKTHGPPTTLNGRTKRTLTFEQCSLSSGDEYSFTFTATDTDLYFSVQADIDVEIIEESPNFGVFITQNNFQHIQNQALTLTGGFILNGDLCDETKIGDFIWSCTKNGDACSDPDNIFRASEESLTIPASYFSNIDDEFIFTLSVDIGSSSSSAISEVLVVDQDQRSIQLFCSSTRSCAQYVNQASYALTADNVNSLITLDDELEYEWTISKSLIQSVPYFNSLKLLPNDLSITENVLLEVLVADPWTNQRARASMTLYYNNPPELGSMTVSPSSGQAIATEFTLTATGWNDDDLPLSYQFLYVKPTNKDQYSLIGKLQYSPQATTILPGGNSDSSKIDLIVRIYDGLYSYTEFSNEATVTTSFGSLEEYIDAIDNLISQLDADDPETSASQIQIASITTVSQENIFENSTSQSQIDLLIQTKLELLQQLESVVEDVSVDEQGRQVVMDSLDSSSKSVTFNTNETLIEVQDILENMVDMSDNEDLVSEENAELIASILDNFVAYSSNTDCNVSTNLTKDLEERTVKYLEKTGRSYLAQLVPNQEPTIQGGKNIDSVTFKARPKDLSKIKIKTQENTPTITIKPDLNVYSDFNEEFEIQISIFKNDIFACEDDYEDEPSLGNKDFIAIKIKDKKGEQISKGITLNISPVKNQLCPNECDCSDPNNYVCDEIEFFDFTRQIGAIFARSNLNKLINDGILLRFPFWQTVTFWCIVVFTLWFIISLIIINKKLKNHCSLQAFLKSEVQSRKKALLIILLVNHPLLGVYYYIDPKIVKFHRVSLYYTRLVLILAYTSLFGNIATDEGFNFYVFIFPYITYIPIQALLKVLLQHNPDEDSDEDKKKKKFCWKFKSRLGVLLSFAMVIASYVIILTISAQQTHNQRKFWAINFGIVVFQEVIFNPLSIFLIKFFAYRWYYTNKRKLTSKKQRLLEKWFGEAMLKVMDQFKELGKATVVLRGNKQYTVRMKKGGQAQKNQLVDTETGLTEAKTPTPLPTGKKGDLPVEENSLMIDQALEGDEIEENFDEKEEDDRRKELVRDVKREKKWMEPTKQLSAKIMSQGDVSEQ